MPKERNFNPVQAQRKAEKAKAIKKGKSEVQARRNEKLARRNPERLQKQIDDLKAITSGGGKLSRHEEQLLEGLENDLRAVRKAREALGDNAPTFGRSHQRENDRGSMLGKRRRDTENTSSDEDVPADVRAIPMPRDTPPPIPKAILDEWYAKRRARRNPEKAVADSTDGKQEAKTISPAVASSKTVYEAKPIVRDLRKEAVTAFVPTAVKMKLDKGKGHSGLMEPEEADRLEREGYLKTTNPPAPVDGGIPSKNATVEEVEDEDG